MCCPVSRLAPSSGAPDGSGRWPPALWQLVSGPGSPVPGSAMIQADAEPGASVSRRFITGGSSPRRFSHEGLAFPSQGQTKAVRGHGVRKALDCGT